MTENKYITLDVACGLAQGCMRLHFPKQQDTEQLQQSRSCWFRVHNMFGACVLPVLLPGFVVKLLHP